MAVSFFDDIPQESGIRLGRICGRPAHDQGYENAALASRRTHLLGNNPSMPDRMYLLLLSLASLVRSAAT